MKTILLVDDELAIIEALTEVLTWEGYQVASASNGQEALATLAQAPVDLVLLDYMMPLLDGIQTLRAMRAAPATKDIPVVMMTAAPGALPDDIRREIPVLRKPFDVNVLLDTLERLLSSRPEG